ncbi:BolA family transcriptional regulator [Pseudoroseomonas cervicalis]|uniref:BolA family protein n=1 Tax=Teichococcus cervicalis TaxID=204525 RepID=UPI002788F920|nr:BolA family protein [Pseudoroseomonas cervicalis]MDQ1080181.1 BolA protein [Pseudoroseomonas cervicalis]
MLTRAERMREVLLEAFAAAEIRIEDDSHRHAGHAGARPGGETHYNLVVIAPDFRGMNRVARSRAVHAALAAEFGSGLHALSLRLLTPEEAAPGGPR